MAYTVGEMAKMLHVAPSTLRYYDKEGLLPFVERSSGGIRLFKDSDFEWLSIIECMKQTGMPIKEIKTFIDLCMAGDSTISERLNLIRRQQEAVRAQMAQLQSTLDMLDYKEWYYRTAQQADTCALHATLPEEEIPERFRAIRQRAKGAGEKQKV